MKTFRAMALISVADDPKGDPRRAQVVIRLDCGCEVARTVDRSRILDTTERDGAPGRMVAGKFACDRHSAGP